ncbi:matrin-type protein 2 [Seminavis robusta]|uniref:Matrin-type protein 2 n=1 Tax=Seminavis robusta TaxID=568900 RepID=A0A9N8HHD6_9STRA|nr:matrin-type protein 2 [Seminavis robusta]|eukprot:Sro443_g144020.1 matrin-type protein 2 (297) ;mRNA; f:22805-23940
MSTNLNYKQVANVKRRTWDVEAYEQKAKARADDEKAGESGDKNDKKGRRAPPTDEENAPKRLKTDGTEGEDSKDEFKPAEPGAAGPQGSQRAFLQPRTKKVEIDSLIGNTEIISAEAAAKTSLNDKEGGSVKDGVTKSGVGWHCSVCDCFLKDSMTYLDHINGRKHQRKLGFSMRVERSTKDQMLGRLSTLAKEKDRAKQKSEAELEEMEEPNFHVMVKKKDENEAKKKEERAKKRKEKKKKKKQAAEATAEPKAIPHEEPEATKDAGGDEEEEAEATIDPALAAMMGFSNFGGGK